MAARRGFRSSLAILEMQFEPLGVAAGAASFMPGYLNVGCSGWDGLDVAPEPAGAAQDFYNQLWSSAIKDLEDHAVRLGADGVVGVTASQMAAGPGWQLQLSGTAFRLPAVEQLPVPFLSLLPMSSFLTLLAAGWIPGGIAWGIGAFHVHGPAVAPTLRWQGRANWTNCEMPGPTQAVMAARNQAERAVAASLRGTGCHGIVGMTVGIEQQVQACFYGGVGNYGARGRFYATGGRSGIPGRLVVATAIGTGIARFGDPVLRLMPTRQLTGVK